MRTFYFVILLLFAPPTCLPAADSNGLIGLWVYAGKWQQPPAIIRRDNPNAADYAGAIILRFCPNGRFMMARGVLYRSLGKAVLGPDDGLAIYSGTWAIENSQIVVDYRLFDYEISFKGIEDALKYVARVYPVLRSGDLSFDVLKFAPLPPKLQIYHFVHQSRLNWQLGDRFVECQKPEK